MSPFVHVYTCVVSLHCPGSSGGWLCSAGIVLCLRIKALWRLKSFFVWKSIFDVVLKLYMQMWWNICNSYFGVPALLDNLNFLMLLTHLLHEMIIFPKGGWSNTLCILWDLWDFMRNVIFYMLSKMFTLIKTKQHHYLFSCTHILSPTQFGSISSHFYTDFEIYEIVE